jgi:Ca-activated chloride channel family protein
VLKDFIDKRPNDRIGLVVFAAQAFIATPLTLDHDYLQENLDAAGNRHDQFRRHGHRRRAGHGGEPAARFEGEKQNHHPATDGGNNSGKVEPLLAAEAAAALGVKIYTVGIGEQGPGADAGNMFGRKRCIR